MGFMGFEFQPSNLMVPFIFLLFEFLLRNRYIPFILTALFVATLKENAGFLIISLGLFQWLYKGKFKSGLFIAFLGGIILLLVSQILIPYFAGEWIQASILDPNCCFPQKIHFVLLVLMCSSFFILLYPKALIVLLPSLLTSLLVGMNKAGAFTIEFHYQDIPLCVSFSLLALELSKNPDILPKYLMPKLELRIVVSIFLMITFTFMTKSSFLFANSHKITKESKDAISALERFQKDYNTDQRDIKIWAQSSLAFNLSSLYNIRCILDANWILADEERNYIILSDASPERWPIYGDYDRLKQTLIDNSEEGSRIAIRGYEPLLIFERKTRR
jgi:uncharacterized membrane protein